MSLLANPGFHSTSNTDFLGGTSNPNFCAGTSNPNLCTGTSHYDADYYTPDMVAVSRGLENIEINYTEPTHPHTHVSENFMPHEDENADHIADTFANCSDEGSEPDEVEFPIPPENGPNDVDINVIAEEFARGQVKCNPTFAIKHVIQAVKDHTGYDIPYQKAWYSLKMAREIVYGTWESSVQKLPKYMGAVQKYNPGTVVEWKHKALHPTGAYVIGYVFWAFKPCIEGFKFCRNIISVDGTHLYTRYKHKMLIAATMDGNQQVLPLAFAIVDDESYASWKWFLQQLSRHVIRGRRGVCLISDRHAGIIKAVNESSEFVPPNGVHSHEIRSLATIRLGRYKNANKDLDSTPMLSNLLTGNVHAANGINLGVEAGLRCRTGGFFAVEWCNFSFNLVGHGRAAGTFGSLAGIDRGGRRGNDTISGGLDGKCDNRGVLSCWLFVDPPTISLRRVEDYAYEDFASSESLALKLLADNRFLIRFNHHANREKALVGCPWVFDRNLVILHRTMNDENPLLVDLSHSPFQVHIHGLPIRMMTRDVVEATGARLGTVIECALSQAQLGWESKIRVKVSLDVRKPLKRGLCLRSPGGKELMVSFTYEKLPMFCHECGVLGHIIRDCELRLEKLDKGEEGVNFKREPGFGKLEGSGNSIGQGRGLGLGCWENPEGTRLPSELRRKW
ncbi:UNVERIFIED_CONTAM: hypothetical protein Sradi_3763000 [Sesamum radiatum]|uniref:CCHC-type domain-containing protein n=1 Tax=Sesamum radiatum TaxID=300843 RepID=A0AAW2PZ65_SESRA